MIIMKYGPIKSPLWEMHFNDQASPKGISPSELEKRALEAFFEIQKSYEELSNTAREDITPTSVDYQLKIVVDTLKNFSELMDHFDELIEGDDLTPPDEAEND